MADKEFLDLFVRLKGEINQLEKLKTSGINIKANLIFNKSGGFAKLESLKKTLNINVKLNLQGRGYENLKKLQKGITIPVKFEYSQRDILSNTSRAVNKRTVPSTPARASSVNVSRVNSYLKEGVPVGRPSSVSRETSRRAAKSFEDQFNNIVLSALRSPSVAKTVQSYQAPRGIAPAYGKLQRVIPSSGNIGNSSYPTSDRVRNIGGSRVVVNRQQNQDITPKAVKNIRSYTAPYQPAVDNELDRLERKEAIRLQNVQDRANARRSSARFSQRLRSARLSRFQSRERLEEAQNEVDLAFDGSEANRRKIALRYNLLPNELQPPRKRNAFARRTNNFLNTDRLRDPETAREIGFAALFGHGIFGKIAGVSGALLGGSIGKGGAFLGAATSDVIFEGLIRNIERLKDVFLSITNAGLTFEESILGISSILQATSTVTGPGGAPVPISDQLQFQESRARDIQLQARKGLLPLGIGGETEASLVQGIITGFAQKGIQLNPDQIATLSKRLGGAIQAQRPDLLNNVNRLRLELEDAIANPSRRTALTPVLRAFAPGLGKATSGEDAIRLTQGLEAFPTALTNNTTNAVQALRQFNAEIEQIKVSAGSESLRILAPAIREFTEVIKADGTKDALVSITKSIAEFVATIIRLAALLAKNLPKNPEKAGSLVGGLGGIGVGAGLGGFAGGALGLLGLGLGILDPALLPFIALGTAGGAALGGVVGGTGGRAVGKSAAKASAEQAKKEEAARKEQEKLQSQVSGSTLINSLLEGGAGGKSNFTRASLGQLLLPLAEQEVITTLLEEAKKIPDRKERLDRINAIPSEALLSRRYTETELARQQTSGLQDLQQRRGSGFDLTTASGLAGKAQSDLAFTNRISTARAGEIAVLTAQIDAIKSEKILDSDPEAITKRILNQKRLADAQEELDKSYEALAQDAIKAADATKQFFRAISQRKEDLLSGIDTGTLIGQEQSRNLDQSALDANLKVLAKSVLPDEIRNTLAKQFAVQQERINRARELAPLQTGSTILSAQSALFNSGNLQQNLKDRLTSYENAIKESEFGLKTVDLSLVSLNTSFKELELSGDNLRRSIEISEATFKSQRLGADAQKLNIAEQIVSEGGAVPTGVNPALVKGSVGFNQAARRQFNLELLNSQYEEADQRSRQLEEEQEAQRKSQKLQKERLTVEAAELENRKALIEVNRSEAQIKIRQAKIAKEGFPIEKAQAELNNLSSLFQLRQALPPGSKLSGKINTAITQSVQLSDIFKGFDVADVFKIIEEKGKLPGGEFGDITSRLDPMKFDLSLIEFNINDIASMLKKLLDLRKESNDRLTKESKDGTTTNPNKGFSSFSASGEGGTDLDDIIYTHYRRRQEKKGLLPKSGNGTGIDTIMTGPNTPLGGGSNGSGTGVTPNPPNANPANTPNPPNANPANTPNPESGTTTPNPESGTTTVLKSLGDLPKGGGPIAQQYTIKTREETPNNTLQDPLSYSPITTPRPGVSGYGFSNTQISTLKALYNLANDTSQPESVRQQAISKYMGLLQSNKDTRIFGKPSEKVTKALGLVPASVGVYAPQSALPKASFDVPTTSLPIKPSALTAGGSIAAGIGTNNSNVDIVKYLSTDDKSLKANTTFINSLPDERKEYLQGLIADGYSPEVIQEIIKKWRYPIGNGGPNVLDTYKTIRTTGGPNKFQQENLNILGENVPSFDPTAGLTANIGLSGSTSNSSDFSIKPSFVSAGASPGGVEGLPGSFGLAVPSGTKQFTSGSSGNFMTGGTGISSKASITGSIPPLAAPYTGKLIPARGGALPAIGEAILGGLLGSDKSSGAKDVFGGEDTGLSALKSLAKTPNRPISEEKTAANTKIGEQILGALTNIANSLDNPQGFGNQVKSALNSTFAGGE